ncbi:MAG: cell surface protein SprA [Halioglobus sp.]|jgi:cell surface protein SprA
MKITRALVTILFVSAFIYAAIGSGGSRNLPDPYEEIFAPAMVSDTIPIKDNYGDHVTDPNNNPFDITSNVIEQKVEYDPTSGNYIIYEKIGDEYYRTPTYLTFEEYLEFKKKEQQKAYFQRLAGVSSKKGLNAKTDPMERIDIQNSIVDRLFGGTEVNIQPQGQVDVTLQSTYYNSFQQQAGFNGNGVQFNPIDPDVDIRVSTEGNIGTKLNLDFNYDTQSTFNFDQQIKLEYDTEAFGEDDIIKKIEAGNVSLPLRGNLIQGAQSLFGLKTELQFGHLRLTAIASQQQSEQNNLRIENGAAVQEFELAPDEYDENRHFFVSHYNRATFERNLSNLPQIATSFRISQLEVWISEDRPTYQQRSTPIVAFSDLGEPDVDKYTGDYTGMNEFEPNTSLIEAAGSIYKDLNGFNLPDNRVNKIYEKIVLNETSLPEFEDVESQNLVASILEGEGFVQNRDFSVFTGRKLSSNEFSYNEQLGMLSLNIRLRPNQNLAVAYNYTYTANCDAVYNVGNLSADGSQFSSTSSNIGGVGGQQDTITNVEPPKVLFTKLLKSSVQQTNISTWDLMMKNVYPLRATQLNPEEFRFDIFFEDDSDGSLKKFIPEPGFTNQPLLEVFNLDRLNKYNDPQADGLFDFVPGITVIPSSGSVVFPVLEPFGSSLDSLLKGLPQDQIENYKFQQLYDTSITIAKQSLEQNKFLMKGEVTSASNGEINLGPFVPEGSVRVRAGGVLLQEGVDYEVDYSLGRLRIINDSYLQQGTPINVSFEDQSLFSLQQKTMLGLRADYDFNDHFSIGATYLKLSERPFTSKVNIGNDPINNRIFGIDMAYSNEAPFVTKIVDKLPFYSTKEKSSINFSAEAAFLKPGHSGAINAGGDDEDKGGVVSIDDFEGAVNGLLLGGFNSNQWRLASTPSEFPESKLNNDLRYGTNRAKVNWYSIDRQARTSADNESPYTRLIDQQELFNRDVQVGQSELLTFDIGYYPSEKGPYNFDETDGLEGDDGENYSMGIEPDDDGNIRLKEPETRWGGIMRSFQNSDFEAANYEFIEFWMLNPYADRPDGETLDDAEENGEIVIQLGNISEDIVKDGNQFYENTLPLGPESVTSLINTNWGQVSLLQPVNNGFDVERGIVQDVGFDGIKDSLEQVLHADYLLHLRDNGFNSDANNDASGDNYEFISPQNSTLDLLTRFKNFNNPEGNAPIGQQRQTNELARGNRNPESEDLNNNRSLDSGESYYNYTVNISKQAGTGPGGSDELDVSATKFITEIKEVQGDKWYRFRIPITTGSDVVVGDIAGFRSIQFMRMYMTKFKSAKTFRLADFQLVRNLWRKSEVECEGDGSQLGVEFSVDEVGVEENGDKAPFGYVTPRGIVQEELFSTFSNLLQDEKSLALNFCGLDDGCSVAINKLAKLDLTQYDRLQLFMHAETEPDSPEIPNGELYGYIRFGKDLVNHYYEYEIPLEISTDSIADPQRRVWPDTNMIDVKFSEFKQAKKNRIIQNTPLNIEFEYTEGPSPGTIRVKGTPSLGYIKVFEVGVRNRTEVDGDEPFCGEVWVNELRAAGLNEKGGMAAQARLQIQMADLGEINLAANYSTIGWGGLDQRLLERNREEILQYDAAANLQLGKFFPSEWGINIPFYAQYSKDNSYQQFDPFERDLTVDEKVDALQESVGELTRTQRVVDSLVLDVKERSKETSTIKTFNFTNVKKEGKGGKPWSISNFSASYAYTETVKTDAIIKEDITQEYTTTLDYNYSNKTKGIQPFKKLKNKNLRLLKEFNFNLLPKSFTFSTNINRLKNSRTFRLPSSPVFKFDDRRFLWDRNYGLNWDFTKALKFTFRAQASSLVDELRQVGIADNEEDRDWVDETGSKLNGDGQPYDALQASDYRNNNLRNLGRSKNYKHNVGLQYTLPIRYLPYMDWINVKTDYKADYSWAAGSLILIDDADSKRFGDGGTPLGNIIQNNQTRSINGTFSFDKLYAKSKYLKKIDKGNKKSRRSRSRNSTSRSNAKNKGKGKKSKKDEKKEEREVTMIERILLRPLLSLRSIKATYKETEGTLIPGFMEDSNLLGLANGFGAPGWEFAAGLRPDVKAWAKDPEKKRWFNPSAVFSEQVSQNNSRTIDLKIALEPFKDFDIDIDFKKSFRRDETFVLTNKGINPDPTNLDFNAIDSPEFVPQAQYEVGSFEISNMGIGSLFSDASELYANFKNARESVSLELAQNDFSRLVTSNPDSASIALTKHSADWVDDDGNILYYYGYGPNNYDVAVPAFLATYLGGETGDYSDLSSDAKSLSWSKLPKPNWTIKYDGLSKMDVFKDVFTSFTINHSYKGAMQVNRFNTTLEYRGLIDNRSPVNDNYFSRIQIPAITISDQFSPLIGVSVKTKSEMTIEAEWRKSRSLSLSLEDLREQTSNEFRFGFGYTIKNFRSSKKKGKRRKKAQKDAEKDDKKSGGLGKSGSRGGVKNNRGKTLTMNLDFSIIDTRELIYEVSQGVDGQVNSGQNSIQISPSVDYDINENLTMRFFFDYNYTESAISIGSNRRLNIRGGVTAQLKIN